MIISCQLFNGLALGIELIDVHHMDDLGKEVGTTSVGVIITLLCFKFMIG